VNTGVPRQSEGAQLRAPSPQKSGRFGWLSRIGPGLLLLPAQRPDGCPRSNPLPPTGVEPLQNHNAQVDLLGIVAYKETPASALDCGPFFDTTSACALRLVEQQNPKDPSERLAAMQARWTYARHATLANGVSQRLVNSDLGTEGDMDGQGVGINRLERGPFRAARAAGEVKQVASILIPVLHLKS